MLKHGLLQLKELQLPGAGYLILTRLLKVVINAMDVKPDEVTLAMDSQCTFSKVEKSEGLLTPYFASQIAEASSNLDY